MRIHLFQGPTKAPELIINTIKSDSENLFTEDLIDINEDTRIKWCGNASFKDYLDVENPISTILESGTIPLSL